jgi:ribosomal protein S14
MKQNIKDILKYKLQKKNELKKELKKKILKSIIQNKYNIPIYQAFAQFKLSSLNKNFKFNRRKKICLMIGNKRGVVKKINLSRHKIKYFNTLGEITNLKLKS